MGEFHLLQSFVRLSLVAESDSFPSSPPPFALLQSMGALLTVAAAPPAGPTATGATGTTAAASTPAAPAAAAASPAPTTPPPTQPLLPQAESASVRPSSSKKDTPGAAGESTPSVKPAEVWPPDQCGLEDFGPEWTPWEGPQRIKECRLTPEEKEKFKKILDRIFADDTVMGKKLTFHPDEIMEVANGVIPYLQSEPMLIEDVLCGQIVGDLHGQLYDLDRVFCCDDLTLKPGYERGVRYVFLGDYVDRGRQSTEVVMALFILKMFYPDQIFLLRGNHEFVSVNHKYGFLIDFIQRYSYNVALRLYFTINEAFCYLSIAAIVGDKYFCSHAGISPTGFTRRQLRGHYKPYYEAKDHAVIYDICWSDPAQGLQGTVFNKDRQGSIYYGFDALAHALKSMECIGSFRGHSMMKEGYEINWNCSFTIFTAADYCQEGNKGAVAVVDERGKVSIRILVVNPKRAAFEHELVRRECPGEKDAEEKTLLLEEIGPGTTVKM